MGIWDTRSYKHGDDEVIEWVTSAMVPLQYKIGVRATIVVSGKTSPPWTFAYADR